MDAILDKTAPLIAISAAGIFFMVGLLAGAWKYFCMQSNERKEAPYYVNICHRAALMYAFAALLVATFAYFSIFPDMVNIIATIAPLLFFAIAIIFYAKLGLENDTDNHLRDSDMPGVDKALMTSLMIAEIGGFGVLLIGFFLRITQ
jgi:hypothetical protein